jgi:hypothetical protein
MAKTVTNVPAFVGHCGFVLVVILDFLPANHANERE